MKRRDLFKVLGLGAVNVALGGAIFVMGKEELSHRSTRKYIEEISTLYKDLCKQLEQQGISDASLYASYPDPGRSLFGFDIMTGHVERLSRDLMDVQLGGVRQIDLFMIKIKVQTIEQELKLLRPAAEKMFGVASGGPGSESVLPQP
jgi:hypothetical protein